MLPKSRSGCSGKLSKKSHTFHDCSLQNAKHEYLFDYLRFVINRR